MTDLQACVDEVTKSIEALSKHGAGGHAAFCDLLQSIGIKGTPSPGTRALLGAALGVAARSEETAYAYARDAARAGVDLDQMRIALSRGVLMASGPSSCIAAEALCRFKEFRTTLSGNANRFRHEARSASIAPETRPFQKASRFDRSAGAHEERAQI